MGLIEPIDVRAASVVGSCFARVIPMAPEQISFGEAEQLIQRHGLRFQEEGVIGVGIGERNHELSFVVAVKSEKMRRRLAERYLGAEVDGFPVHVETGQVVCMGGADCADWRTANSERVDLLQEVIDRPGFLLLAAALAVGAAIWLSR